MKAILFIALLLVCCGCKTYNVYLIETKQEPVYPALVCAPSVNRFTSQFHGADSLFRVIEKASEDAMKAAHEKTKHLSPK